MSYLFAFLLFSFLILIHEFGHFAAAKAFGVRVNEFSMFMGPVLWKKEIGETTYSIRCIPIGGYCAMEGEEGPGQLPGAFSAAAWWKRLVILAAGSVMNFLTGMVLLGVFFAPSQKFVVPVVDSVEPECVIAGEYGIQPGDRLYALDGERIYTYSDFNFLLSMREGDVHDLTILRNGKKLTFQDFEMVKSQIPNEDGTTSLRFGFNFRIQDANLAEKAAMIWNTSMDCVRLVRLSIKMLFSGEASVQDVSGPVGIVQGMAEIADAAPGVYDALMSLVYFGAFIAINLAVMNLLPIPALDGGRIACLLLTLVFETVTRRKIDPKYEGYLHGIGMLVLLLLMALILFKDIFFIIMR